MISIGLVPSEGDPHGFLSNGPIELGGKSPIIYSRVRVTEYDEQVGVWGRPWTPHVKTERALPLWWRGKLVPAAWDRTLRILWDHKEDRRLSSRALASHNWRHPTIEQVLDVAENLARAELIARVLRLDAECKEIGP